jgi:hypothetical protein
VRVYWLIIGTLAVWRVTHLVVAEDGPWHAFARLRRRAGEGVFGQLLDCFYCSSLWIAAPAAWLIGGGWRERAFLWLALSGGAILLERATTAAAPVPPAAYREDPEEHDGMLRKE